MDSARQAPLSQGDADTLSELAPMEKRILKLIFEGVCSSEVAQELKVSKRTVDFYLAKAYIKLGVSNRFQAFKRAVELGIISDQ